MSSSNTLTSASFSELAESHRRALHVHCYRMLGSFEEAEDVVQESLLRAWRRRASFEGRSPFRSWLYRIATNACLDSLRRTLRRVLPTAVGPPNTGPIPAPYVGDTDWLQPYPDRYLDDKDNPEVQVVARETIELTFIAAIQLLPPRQRAAFLVREVMGWSANETADVLQTSVASVNSLAQRARATLRDHRPASRTESPSTPEISAQERRVLEQFMQACERADVMAVVALLSEDVQCSMPPYTWWFAGREAVAESFHLGLGAHFPGEFRTFPTQANRQPASATYVRRPGESSFTPFAIDVLRIHAGQIADITAFHVPHLFSTFSLPPSL